MVLLVSSVLLAWTLHCREALVCLFVVGLLTAGSGGLGKEKED